MNTIRLFSATSLGCYFSGGVGCVGLRLEDTRKTLSIVCVNVRDIWHVTEDR